MSIFWKLYVGFLQIKTIMISVLSLTCWIYSNKWSYVQFLFSWNIVLNLLNLILVSSLLLAMIPKTHFPQMSLVPCFVEVLHILWLLFLIICFHFSPCIKCTPVCSDAKYSYRALSQSDELDKILDLDSKENTYHDTSDEVRQLF